MLVRVLPPALHRLAVAAVPEERPKRRRPPRLHEERVRHIHLALLDGPVLRVVHAGKPDGIGEHRLVVSAYVDLATEALERFLRHLIQRYHRPASGVPLLCVGGVIHISLRS